ncbi:hypothetical protein CW304_12365 [Bacillus sp. UFRGS-B20]|nr:hypothetical protein CW304_12365 [Bacillus sp. UFRGS-B20]
MRFFAEKCIAFFKIAFSFLQVSNTSFHLFLLLVSERNVRCYNLGSCLYFLPNRGRYLLEIPNSRSNLSYSLSCL